MIGTTLATDVLTTIWKTCYCGQSAGGKGLS